jgi:hypothetical protein
MSLKGHLAPNKTPYELRLELLHLAQSIAISNTENAFNLLHLKNEKKETALGKFEGKSVVDSFSVPTPSEDCDEVLLIAKKLNDFVSKG